MLACSFGREELTTAYEKSELGKVTTKRYVLFIPFTTDPEYSEDLMRKIILYRSEKEETTLLESDYSHLLVLLEKSKNHLFDYNGYCFFGLLRSHSSPINKPTNSIAKRYSENAAFRARLKSMFEKKELSSDFFLYVVNVNSLLALELVMSGRYTEAEVMRRRNLDSPSLDIEPDFEWPVNY